MCFSTAHRQFYFHHVHEVHEKLLKSKPIWEHYFHEILNFFVYFLVASLFIYLSIKTLQLLFHFITKQEVNKLHISTMLFAIFEGMYNPLNIDLDFIFGKTSTTAYYEGTQNQATLKIRTNGTFDINWTSIIFTKTYHGHYTTSNDTLYLNFITMKPKNFPDILLVRQKEIIAQNKNNLGGQNFIIYEHK